MVVDLTPEALQQRLEAGKVYPKERADVALVNFFKLENLSALRELSLREVAEDVEHRRQTELLDPLGQQAIGERVLAMIEPQPKSQRIMRRAWRSAQRLGADIDAVWVRPAERSPTEEETTQLAALRRLAGILGIHFLEEQGDDLVATVRRVAAERGSTYIFVGTPDESRRREIFGGSLLSRMTALVIALAGLVVALTATLAYRSRPPRQVRTPQKARRILLPFTGNSLDPTVLDAAIRIAHAEDAVLVPAYLLRVPFEYSEDSPLTKEVGVAMPLLEAVEHTALRCGFPSTRGSKRSERRHMRSAGSGMSSSSTA